MRYRLHGLTVDSEVPLEAERCAGAAAPDLVVQWGQSRHVPTELPEGTVISRLEQADGVLRQAVCRTPRGIILRFTEAVDVEVTGDLQRASVHVDPRFDPELASVVLAGFVMAVLLQLKGDVVLHASAVEVAGRAIAVAGASGSGKSTTATLLCRAGAHIVTDDLMRTCSVAGGGAIWRGPSSTRLREAAAHLAESGSRSPDGRVVAHLAHSALDQLPVQCVLLPRPRRDFDEVAVRQLHGMAAVVPLLAAPRVLGWRDPETLAHQLRVLTAISTHVPVAELHVPWGPPFRESLGKEILSALASAQLLNASSVPSTE